MFDLVVRNGMVVDGTGAPARRADIGISDGRIAEIGTIAAGGHSSLGTPRGDYLVAYALPPGR